MYEGRKHNPGKSSYFKREDAQACKIHFKQYLADLDQPHKEDNYPRDQHAQPELLQVESSIVSGIGF